MCTIEKDGRYTYYICDNKVVCVSSFAKKKIKGIAKCSPNDTFDIEIGKQLSRSRCDLKIATKRYAKAHNLLIEKLKEINANVIGTVLNDSNNIAKSEYHYYYGKEKKFKWKRKLRS